MKVTMKIVGAPVSGPAEEAAEPVAQETNSPMSVELPEGAIVSDLLGKASTLGVPVDTTSMVLVNGEKAGDSAPLHDGDAVTIIGQVLGM